MFQGEFYEPNAVLAWGGGTINCELNEESGGANSWETPVHPGTPVDSAFLIRIIQTPCVSSWDGSQAHLWLVAELPGVGGGALLLAQHWMLQIQVSSMMA